MFQILAEKVISGLAAFSMLLLSSYQSNEANFADYSISFLDDRMFLECKLENAFENDFEEIFKSGQTINIFFNIEININGEIIHEEEFKHTIIFDPLKQVFNIALEEQELTFVTDSYIDLKKIVSKIEYDYENEFIKDGTLKINAYLPKIRLESLNREFNLMMLWKYNKPELVAKLESEYNEN